MFFCIINIDLIDYDYYYRLILHFYDEEICNNVIKKINNGEYNAEFAKNCVYAYAEFSNNESFLDKSTFFNENDAIKFIESFFKDYGKEISYLEYKYKMILVYFRNEEEDYTEEDFSDY